MSKPTLSIETLNLMNLTETLLDDVCEGFEWLPKTLRPYGDLISRHNVNRDKVIGRFHSVKLKSTGEWVNSRTLKGLCRKLDEKRSQPQGWKRIPNKR